MVTIKGVMPCIIRGQISIWLILFISLALSGVIFFLQDQKTIIGLTNEHIHLSENAVSGSILQQERKLKVQDCVLGYEYWMSLKAQAERYSTEHVKLFLIDQITFKQNQGCRINEELQQGLLNYFHKNKYPADDISLLFKLSDKTQSDIIQQQRYLQYQKEKEALVDWVEDNLQPGQSYEEVYSNELLKLQNRIFE